VRVLHLDPLEIVVTKSGRSCTQIGFLGARAPVQPELWCCVCMPGSEGQGITPNPKGDFR
jgi:hypothetical protein